MRIGSTLFLGMLLAGFATAAVAQANLGEGAAGPEGVGGEGWLDTLLAERDVESKRITLSLEIDSAESLAPYISFGPFDAAPDQIKPSLAERKVSLEITATGERHEAAIGSRVWIESLRRQDGTQVDLSQFVLDAGWSLRTNSLEQYFLLSDSPQPAIARWKGEALGAMNLEVRVGERIGRAIIKWNGQEIPLDLFSRKSGKRALKLALSGYRFSARGHATPGSNTTLSFVGQPTGSCVIRKVRIDGPGVKTIWENGDAVPLGITVEGFDLTPRGLEFGSGVEGARIHIRFDELVPLDEALKDRVSPDQPDDSVGEDINSR